MRKTFKLFTALLVIALSICVFTACASPFATAPDGLSEDNRTFTKIKDERMDAEASDYKGYIFKKGDTAFCSRLKSPKNIEAGKTYPLIIFLHGSGDYGSNNSAHMYKSLIYNAEKYVSEEVFVWMPQGIKNYSWEKSQGKYKGMDELYNAALSAILEHFQINTDRVYLTGMSMGGFGTFYQAYNNFEKYAAIAPICGYFPDDIFSDLSAIKALPIWLGHSRTDETVSFSESEKIYNRLVAAGASDIKNTWLDKYKHDMTQPFYDNADFWQWLMSKQK